MQVADYFRDAFDSFSFGSGLWDDVMPRFLIWRILCHNILFSNNFLIRAGQSVEPALMKKLFGEESDINLSNKTPNGHNCSKDLNHKNDHVYNRVTETLSIFDTFHSQNGKKPQEPFDRQRNFVWVLATPPQPLPDHVKYFHRIFLN